MKKAGMPYEPGSVIEIERERRKYEREDRLLEFGFVLAMVAIGFGSAIWIFSMFFSLLAGDSSGGVR